MKNYIIFLAFNIITLVSCNFGNHIKSMNNPLAIMDGNNIIFYPNGEKTILQKNIFDSIQDIRKNYDKFKNGHEYSTFKDSQKIKTQDYLQSMLSICEENSLDLFKTINLLKYHFTAEVLYDLSIKNSCLQSIRENILKEYNSIYEKAVKVYESEIFSSTIRKFAKELSFTILSDMNYFESNEITDVEVYFSILESYEKLLSTCLEKEKTLCIITKLFDICLHEYVKEIVEQINNFTNYKIELYEHTKILKNSKIKGNIIKNFDFFRIEDENNWNNKAKYRQNIEESQIRVLNILFSAVSSQEDRSNLSYLSKHLLNSEYIRTSILGKNEKINFDEIFIRDCDYKLNLQTNSLIIKKESELEFILETFKLKNNLEDIALHKDLQSKSKPKKKKKKVVLEHFEAEERTKEIEKSESDVIIEKNQEEKEEKAIAPKKFELLKSVEVNEKLNKKPYHKFESKYDFILDFINERPNTMNFKDVEKILKALDIKIYDGKGSHIKLVYTNKSNQIITRGLFKLHNKDSYGTWAIKYLLEVAKERLDDIGILI